MKKLLLIFFLTLTTIFSYSQCDYTLTLNDSYGDGWYDIWGDYNGYIAVVVNGTNTGNWIINGSSGYITMTVNDGDIIDFTYNSLGGTQWYYYEDENSWLLTDCNGKIVWEGVGGSTQSTSITVDCSSCNLPVSFLSSEYDCSKKSLSWQTASETNNDYFTIKTGTYDKFGFISENEFNIPGNGNTNYISNYFYDLDVNDIYIELWQTDYDGTTTLLDTKYISCFADEHIEIYPNPSIGTTYIKGEYKTIQIYNIFGTKMDTNIINNQIIGLKTGIYIVVINEQYKVKLIIK